MRGIAMAALAVALLSAGCGNSVATTSGASVGGSTGGGTVGGSTGGGTTAGRTSTAGSGTSTTGGGSTIGNLAAGQPCGSDPACASGICGVAGAGKCCRGPGPCRPRDGGDLTCGAIGCDDTGACIFPDAGTSCGESSCLDAFYTPAGSCDGAGSCTPGTGGQCNGYYSCDDAGACKASCIGDADCTLGVYCNAGHCRGPRNAGSCTENQDCWSDACSGLSDAGADGGGSGFCCLQVCPQPSATCPVACAESTGECEYPVGAVCSDPGCLSDQYTTYACDQNGLCAANPVPCPASFGCNAARTACNTSCATNSDCASGSSCDAGTCSP